MKNQQNRYISKIEIKGLWNKYDLVWQLNKDVNILSGTNGSGKSTILRCIYEVLTSYIIEDIGNHLQIAIPNTFNLHKEKVDSFTVFLDNNYQIICEIVENVTYKSDDLNPTIPKDIRRIRIIDGENKQLYQSEYLQFYNQLQVNFINTFDNNISEVVSKIDDNVYTELDKTIFKLQKQYLDYQLNINKRKDEIVDNAPDIKKAIAELRQPQNRFLEILDTIFAATDKKVKREENEVVFANGSSIILPYQLSSGEKQMLVILMTVLVQDHKPSILLLDEPEISLHFDWQRKLVSYILELNPNVQIILATHSPAIIMDGLLDKVTEMSDIIVIENQKSDK